jgi:hypothetical protein
MLDALHDRARPYDVDVKLHSSAFPLIDDPTKGG